MRRTCNCSLGREFHGVAVETCAQILAPTLRRCCFCPFQICSDIGRLIMGQLLLSLNITIQSNLGGIKP